MRAAEHAAAALRAPGDGARAVVLAAAGLQRLEDSDDARTESLHDAGVRALSAQGLQHAGLEDACRMYPRLLAGSGRGRKRAGAWYTPEWLVREVLDGLLEGLADAAGDGRAAGPGAARPLRVLDPAAGAGAFLLGAAEAAAARGAPVLLYGIDSDPVACALCRARLAAAGLEANILWGDALAGTLEHWGTAGAVGPQRAARTTPAANPGGAPPAWRAGVFHDADAAGGFDAAIGNPPFLNQTRKATARTGTRDGAAARSLLGEAVGGTQDAAAGFLVLGLRVAREGGAVAMVQPASVLGSAGARRARAWASGRARLERLWVGEVGDFDAGVRTVALRLRRGPGTDAAPGLTTVAVRRGSSASAVGTFEHDPTAETWAALGAAAEGLPPVPVLQTRGTVADAARVTADFRDEYYAAAAAVREAGTAEGAGAAGEAPLITSGLLDCGRHAWGERAVRLAKRRYTRPVADLGLLERSRPGWANARLVPKVLVATQTRVIEAASDSAGRLLPVTPVVSVLVNAEPAEAEAQTALLAAALCSPVLSLLARVRSWGTAMSPGVLKLSAAQIAALPVPAHVAAWREAAALLPEVHAQAAAAHRFAALMNAAYGMASADDEALAEWWLKELRGR